jgi:hypothetical protein
MEEKWSCCRSKMCEVYEYKEDERERQIRQDCVDGLIWPAAGKLLAQGTGVLRNFI